MEGAVVTCREMGACRLHRSGRPNVRGPFAAEVWVRALARVHVRTVTRRLGEPTDRSAAPPAAHVAPRSGSRGLRREGAIQAECSRTRAEAARAADGVDHPRGRHPGGRRARPAPDLPVLPRGGSSGRTRSCSSPAAALPPSAGLPGSGLQHVATPCPRECCPDVRRSPPPSHGSRRTFLQSPALLPPQPHRAPTPDELRPGRSRQCCPPRGRASRRRGCRRPPGPRRVRAP